MSADNPTARELHDASVGPGGWWACSEPERPVDNWCVYDSSCPRCLIKARADLARGGDTPLENLTDRRSSGVRLSELVAGEAGET